MSLTTSEPPSLVGQSRPFLDLIEAASRLAPLDRPVLVVGERGTGKELIAQRLHYLSGRWDQAFVAVNCAALAESLLESELFGHEAGAFTGAARARAGRFELADGGTLFLDEIAHMSAAAQEKLLRVIEYGAFERVGGERTHHVDVRIIGAANVDLPARAARGRFREDLLDRLAFDVLTLPPLRARRADIMLLATHFARAFAIELGWESFPGFTARARGALSGYAWPGNVRELRNVAERAVYRHGDPQTPIDAVAFDPFASPYRPAAPVVVASGDAPPAQAPPVATTRNLRDAVAGFERRLLEDGLEANRFNQRATADALGLGYDQLRNLLRKHRITARSRRPDA